MKKQSKAAAEAPDTEFLKTQPTFALNASEGATVYLLMKWISMAEAHGAAPERVLEAKKALDEISAWREKNASALHALIAGDQTQENALHQAPKQ